MVHKLLIFIFVLSSASIYAKDDKAAKEAEAFLKNSNEAKESAGKAYANRTLFTVYNDNFLVEDHSKSFNKMMSKISDELAQRSSAEPGSVDPDMCTSRCAQYGTSELRMKLFFEVSTKIDLSKETRECQNVCKVYFARYYGYLDGFRAARSKRVPVSSDCSGQVSSGPRSFKPSIGVDPSDLEKTIKTSSGISK